MTTPGARGLFSPWSALFAAAVAVSLVLLSYVGAYRFPLMFDDDGVFAHGVSAIGPRWLSQATFEATQAIGGPTLQLLRLENVLLHAGVVIALFYFCRELVGRWIPAVAAAAVFALHPVTVYGVAYLAQRSIVMATLFSVLALHAWLRGRTEADWRWLAASVACYALAVLSKEHTIMLPAVAFALGIAVKDRLRGTTRQLVVAMAAMAVVALWTLWALRSVVGAAYEPHAAGVAAQLLAAPEAAGIAAASDAGAWPRSAITQALLFFRYVFTWLAPLPQLMSVDVRWDLAPSLSSAPEIAGAVMFLAWGLGGLWLLIGHGRRAIAGFGMLAPWLFFFTEFSAVRVAEPFVLYRSYLWGIGLAVLVAAFAAHLPRRSLILTTTALCLVLAAGMRERLETFSSPLALWDDAVRKLPAGQASFADRAIGNRGVALMRAGRLEEARRDLDRAVQINPRSPVAFYNRAMLLAFAGDVPRAQADLREAQRLQRLQRMMK